MPFEPTNRIELTAMSENPAMERLVFKGEEEEKEFNVNGVNGSKRIYDHPYFATLPFCELASDCIKFFFSLVLELW